MDIYKKLNDLNIILPEPPEKGGFYTQIKNFGDKYIYISGCGPQQNKNIEFTGKLGKDLSLEEGGISAQRCILNALSILHRDLGDLNKIKSFVKILAFVASDDTFYNQPKVVDYASKTLLSIFGNDIGSTARSAIGVNVLPENIPVEIELIVEVKK